MRILVGADPELFVSRDGEIRSAFGLVKGTKKEPLPVSNGAVQVDGMALEFNINPSFTEEEFVYRIEDVLLQLMSMVPEYKQEIIPVAHFSPDYLKEQPEEAVELGCSPDFNAYTGAMNPVPDAERVFRTAAGHIHVGWTENAEEDDLSHFEMCCRLVRYLDLVLGVPSLFLEKPNERRELYGSAGAFRPKPYGCEYRVLSNFWIAKKPLVSWVYRGVMKAVEMVKENVPLPNNIDLVINNDLLEEAKNLIYEFSLEVPHEFVLRTK